MISIFANRPADNPKQTGWKKFFPLLCILVLFFLGMISSCASKSTTPLPSGKPELPQNSVLLRAPYAQVWDVVLNTLRLKYLFPISIEDKSKGVFSSEYIYSESNPNRRYRLSGSVVKTPEGQIVTLYKYDQILKRREWTAVHTNYQLEKKLLKEIERRLN